MKREIIWSLALHLGIVAATLVSSPFEIKSHISMDEVVRVQLTSAMEPAISEPIPLEPVAVPEPIVEEPLEIPISDPSTVDKVAIEKKPDPDPVETPKKEPKQDPTPQQQERTADATEGGSDDATEIEGAGGAGSPFSGATIDNASFDYPYWFTQTFNKIRSNWHNPVAYDGALVCAVYFQVIKSGRVIDLRVESSSGFDSFDQACLAAIERSKPFPPLPRQFTDEIIGLTLPFKYNPR